MVPALSGRDLREDHGERAVFSQRHGHLLLSQHKLSYGLFMW